MAACGFACGQGQSSAVSLGQLLAAKDYKEALTESNALLSRDPADARWWIAKGVCLRGLSRTQESLQAFEKALLLDPDNEAALKGASEAAYLLKDRSAAELLNRLLRKEPSDPVANAMAASLLYENRDCDAAIRHFDIAGSLLPGNTTASLQWSHCLMMEGKSEDAAAVLERLPAKDTDPVVSYDLAFALYSGERFEESAKRLEQLKSTHRAGPDALDLLAQVYGKLERVQEALDTFREACDAGPNQAGYYIDLVLFLMEHTSEPAAIKVLDTAIERNPNSSSLLTVRGSIYSFLGETAKAEADFRSAEGVDPKSGYGRVGRSLQYRTQGRSTEAEEELRVQLAAHPHDVKVEYFLAQTLIDNDSFQRNEEARGLLEDVIKQTPDDPNVLLLLGKIFLENKEPSRALPFLVRAQKLDAKNAAVLNRLLQAYRQLGMKEQSLDIARELRDTVNEDRQKEARRNQFHISVASGDPLDVHPREFNGEEMHNK